MVIGGAELFYEKSFKLSGAWQIGWAMSSALVGALFGAMFAGGLSDKFGRKPLLAISGLLFVVTSIGTALAQSFPFFIENRLLGGVAIGVASNLSPLYIAEIAPASMRGRLVSFNQLAIALGVVAAQIANWLIARPTPPGVVIGQIVWDSWNVQVAWRWMFGVTTAPALLFFLAMFFVPESSRCLPREGRIGHRFAGRLVMPDERAGTEKKKVAHKGKSHPGAPATKTAAMNIEIAPPSGNECATKHHQQHRNDEKRALAHAAEKQPSSCGNLQPRQVERGGHRDGPWREPVVGDVPRKRRRIPGLAGTGEQKQHGQSHAKPWRKPAQSSFLQRTFRHESTPPFNT